MTQLVLPTRRIDRLAITLSGLCLVHCLASAVLLALLSAAGSALGNPLIHEVGLTLAMLLGAVALGRGVMAGALTLPHDGSEALYTVIGVGILALGHELNRIAGD